MNHLIQYISNIPHNNGEDMVIRGELIISDSDFEKNFANEKANARNMVSGLVSRKYGLQKNRMKYVHFVAYEVISPVLSPLEQMKFAEKKNFEVVHNEIIDKMSVEKARFRNPVIPDCKLILKIEAIRSHGRVWKYKGEAFVDEKKMADAVWSATIVDKK